MKITIVGTGYVGLVTATCFAEMGNVVSCVDIDSDKVARMKRGQIPIYEPGLEDLFKQNIDAGRLHFTTKLAEGIQEAVVIFLALPTPPNSDGTADMSFVLQVADDLGPLLQQYTIIVDKSTVPVGTAEIVRKRIAKNTSTPFDVVSNPEFLKEGFAVEDFMKPDRVVIGTTSKRAVTILNELYAPFAQKDNLYFMDERSAEMTKYAANSFLATKISFMNEIANLCEKTGANVDAVRIGIGADERIGKRFLFPGLGYGGSCFPKDVTALQCIAKQNGYTFRILEAVTAVNEYQKEHFAKKILDYYGGNVRNKKFALWGLAFKPDTDDIREAPALEIIRRLTEAGAAITAYDPEAMDNVRKYVDIKKLSLAEDPYVALDGADALVVATEWPVFKTPDFAKVKTLLSKNVIFDGRNLYSAETMNQLGFYYESVGRETVDPRNA